jgi:sterol desaturase/sphingolipid hydroxylase (fatty acid hydroxylase superfamily)
LLNEFLHLITTNPWSTANVLIVVLLIFFELVIPLKKSTFPNRSHYEDIFWLCLNQLISFNLWGLLIYRFGDYVSRELTGWNFNLEALPLGIQFAILFIVSDFVSFITHRFLHTNDTLWKFHQLHHSTENLNTLSAFRHHGIEDLYYGLSHTVLSFIFIVDPHIRLGLGLLITFACYFQHANLRVKFGPWVDRIFITPLNHRWHHSLASYRPKGQNFGLFLSIWDRWFGSYYVPSHEPERLGTSADYPRTLARRLIYPFLK